jgi:DNA-binding protein HU-beta
MSETYTKSDLVKELAQTSQISKRKAEIVLETLTQIAYRETPKGFTVPGICRLDIVERKARQVRNPQTNQTLVIAAHNALRVRPLKKARDTIAPPPRALVQIIEETAPTCPAAAETATPDATSTPAVADRAIPPTPTPTAAPTPATQVIPAADDEGMFLSFRCTSCRQEIESPIEMAGSPNECPTCGESLVVPYTSEPGTVWHREPTSATNGPTQISPGLLAAMKGRTIRIELPDDL